MASDDIIYGLLLFLSIPIGLLVRSFHTPVVRSIICSVIGILLVVITCREHALHSIVTVFVNTVIIISSSQFRYLHVVSFSWCFGYLAFFRTCHWYGVPKPSPLSNAVQLILTLKLVGVAGEVVETVALKRYLQTKVNGEGDVGKESPHLKLKYRAISYSWLDLVTYSYCYIGALTGPFYTCRTFQDFVNNPSANSLPIWENMKHRLKPLPLSAILFVVVSRLVSVQAATEDVFYEETSFLYRWIYLILLFVIFRTRFYCAWILAECMAVTAGLGAYPKCAANKPGGGPTNLQALEELETKHQHQTAYDFETIRNTSPYETEVASTMRHTIKIWNMTVQYWLVTHVYRNIPVSNKPLRNAVLMMISAFWHGVHPGWYATFISVPFMFLAEDGMRRGLGNRLSGERAIGIYNAAASFVRMRYFEYFVVGVFFLHTNEILRFWSSLYYFGHISILGFIFLGHMLSILLPSPRTKSKSN